jgi:hypothetical protein
MPIIVKIGYQDFLVRSEAQAAKAVAALVGCVRLDSCLHGGKFHYWPSDRDSSVGTETISSSQLHASDPSKAKPIISSRLELGPGAD